MPDAGERLRLWRKAFQQDSRLAPDVDLERIAAEFEISGCSICNVLRYACLMALRRGDDTVALSDIRQGIARELRK